MVTYILKKKTCWEYSNAPMCGKALDLMVFLVKFWRIVPPTQLSGIFHSIFQASLSIQKVPTLWKTSIVVPVLKKSRPASPNDFRPVALTSHVMKSFENNHQNHDHVPYRPSFRSPVICILAWERGGGCSRYFNKLCNLSSWGRQNPCHSSLPGYELCLSTHCSLTCCLRNKFPSLSLYLNWRYGCLIFWWGDPNRIECITSLLVWRLFPLAHPKGASYPLFYSFYTLLTAGASVRIGILLNYQMIQLYSICCLTMKLAMVLC